MALLICTGCTAAYAVGAPCCPQCGSRKAVEQGSDKHLALLAASAEPVAAPVKETTDVS